MQNQLDKLREQLAKKAKDYSDRLKYVDKKVKEDMPSADSLITRLNAQKSNLEKEQEQLKNKPKKVSPSRADTDKKLKDEKQRLLEQIEELKNKIKEIDNALKTPSPIEQHGEKLTKLTSQIALLQKNIETCSKYQELLDKCKEEIQELQTHEQRLTIFKPELLNTIDDITELQMLNKSLEKLILKLNEVEFSLNPKFRDRLSQLASEVKSIKV